VPAPPAAAAAAAAPAPSAADSLFGDVPDGPPAGTTSSSGGAAKSEIDALLSGASGANDSNDLFGDEAGV
jgi:hypothetical protein